MPRPTPSRSSPTTPSRSARRSAACGPAPACATSARGDSTNVDYIPSYAIIDASLSYDLARINPDWKGAILSVNATNLFDKRYCTAGFYTGYVFEGFRRSVFGTLTDRW